MAIHAQPAALLVDEHIESWNSSAKIAFSTDEPQVLKATFFFSWLNDSAESVVITGVTSSLTAAGRCFLHVNPTLVFFSFTYLWLWADLKVHLGQTQIDSEGSPIGFFEAYADANIFGGTAHTDIHHVFKTVNVSCLQEILVTGRQPVIFAVEMWIECRTYDGKVVLRFDREPFVHCPSLTVAFLEPLVSFSETLIADEPNWAGYCLVQRIEPVRLSRSGTQVKLTLRASVGGASIDRIYISQADPAGQGFESAADLTPVISAPIAIPANTALTLPAVNYRFDETKPLLIAVDFSTAPASAIRYTNAVPTEVSAFFKLGAEAATANRAGFSGPHTRLYLIERIEVF